MDYNTPGFMDTKELVKMDPYRFPDFTENQYLPWITISNTGNTPYDILNVFHPPYVYNDIWEALDFKEQLKFMWPIMVHTITSQHVNKFIHQCPGDELVDML